VTSVPVPSADTAQRRSPYRWVILVLCWLAFTLTSLDRSTWGPASSSVGQSMGVTLAGLGVFATAYYIGYVISNAGGGYLTDWLGGRRVLAGSLFIAGAFMVAFGSTTSATLGIAFQALVGLFAGADYSAGIKLIAAWFRPSDRGLAMGVFMTATSLGVVIANATVPTLIETFSWHTSYHVFGIVSMIAAVACYVFVRTPAPGAATVTAEPSAALPDPRLLLRNRDLLFLGLAGFGGLWGTYGFITWSNTLMIKGNGIAPTTAGLIVVIFAASAIVAKPLIGIVTDLLGGGRKIPIMVLFAGFVVTLLVFGQLSTATAFLWAAPFLGVFAYVYSPLTAAIIPTLVDRTLTGSAAGLTNAVWQLGSVIVPVVVGAVFSATGSFSAAFGTLAAGPLLGIVFMLGVRERRAGPVTPAEEPATATP